VAKTAKTTLGLDSHESLLISEKSRQG